MTHYGQVPISVGEQRIVLAESCLFPTNKLSYDPDNTRFQDRLVTGELERRDQQSLHKWFAQRKRWRVRELKNDLSKNGLFEPLLVYRDGETFVVLNGNSRLCALKELLKDGSEAFVKIPTFIITDELNKQNLVFIRDREHGYLSPQRHQAFNNALEAYKMLREGHPVSEIQNIMGSNCSPAKIVSVLLVKKFYEGHPKFDPESENITKQFTTFAQVVESFMKYDAQNETRSFDKVDVEKYDEELASWVLKMVYEKRIRQRTAGGLLKHTAMIYRNSEARKILEEANASGQPLPFFKAVKHLRDNKVIGGEEETAPEKGHASTGRV